MGHIAELTDLVRILDLGVPAYLRYSAGPESDAEHPSQDHESGLLMPGVSANSLRPPKWRTLPPIDWVARRICQYLRELREGAHPWILTGKQIDFGPDNEPLLVEIQPIAWLDSSVLAQAHEHCRRELDAGRQTHR